MKKPNKDAILRARATKAEKQEVQWAAMYERLDEADIIRKACASYISRLKAKQNEIISHAA